jgi:hypothetical protein
MTDAKRIARLAKWAGIKHFISPHGYVYLGSINDPFNVGWNPLTDLNHAWMLVEEARKKSWWLSLSQYPSKDAPWQASFSFGGMAVSHSPKFQSEEPTAPLAICRAVEKLIGERTPRICHICGIDRDKEQHKEFCSAVG